jgi:hypothetical protein
LRDREAAELRRRQGADDLRREPCDGSG